ncbi:MULTISPECIES: hypothetical protein [unclassified Campylobacter]|uniref:hypothetical protein n=1 Tax=unclassified Campylobacter TaxID=2593542 RepID=UPI0014764167|nr:MULTISPECIES: hypothetical protein [unclassified Campylobacter]
MRLTFEIENEVDLVDEIIPALNAISHITHALPYHTKGVGINHNRDCETHYFLSCLIYDIADEIEAYADRKTKEAKEIK